MREAWFGAALSLIPDLVTMVSVDGAGTLRWKSRVDSMIQSSPAIGAGGTVYFSSFKSTLYSVHPNNGTVRWTAPLGGTSFSSPALGRQGIYVGANDGGVYAFFG